MNCFPCRSLVRPLTVRKQKAIMTPRDTRSPTPPLPPRNPNRRFSSYKQPLLPLLDSYSDIDLDLLPKPLFSRNLALAPQPDAPSPPPSRRRPSPASSRRTLPPNSIHTDIPSKRSSLAMSSSRASSFAPSQRSSIVSVSHSSASTPRTSASSSPASRPRSLAYPALPSTWVFPPTEPEPIPTPSLRRRKTPRKETLRSLRARETDHRCDQRMLASKRMGLGLGWS